jgi:ATP-binding cassette subfamily F protein 3
MLMVQHRQHESQAAKLAHMQEFVDRFRYNANRAALVQSRIKSMNKEVIIEDAENDDTDGFNFQFADAGDLGRNVIQIEGASFGYLKPEVAAARKKLEAELLAKQQAQQPAAATGGKSKSSSHAQQPAIVLPPITPNDVDLLFADVHLNIDQSSRVALVGPNGAGKSTLLNLIRGSLKPIEGVFHVNPQLRIGVFTQHHLDSFDLNLSPVQV